MGSKREEEKNEKIIRGLMKLPPNRRCINCNSLGPQYVCTNFWTFVCMTCSGIHREFTHRVKSVSMAKFTSQEVDALQKGGNQRARELFLKGWDPHRQRLPDNSNVDKVREFIKNVYVEKRYAIGKSSDKPPRDPQSTHSEEEETRRASSYHSYSQSPPYDFQYEERRYGGHAASLTGMSGSDHILFEGKFSSFLSPSHSGDHVNDESSQRDIGSPFSETSSYFSSEQSGHPTVLPNSDANSGSNKGTIRHPQRTESSGSFGSFDSTSFKSVNSVGLQEVVSEPEQSLNMSHGKTSSVPSLPHSSTFTTFNGVDLFSEPFVPQNVTSPTVVCNPQLSLAQSVDLFQQSPISSVPKFSEQQSVTSSTCHTSGAVMPNNRGWATFDVPQNLLPGGTEDSMASVAPSSNGNNSEKFNPFSLDQTSSSQNSTSCEPTASTHTLWHDGLQKVEPLLNSTQFWNAFEDSPGQHPTQNMLKNSSQDALFCASDANKSLGFGPYEVLNSDENVKPCDSVEPCSSSLSSHFNMAFHDFSMVPAVDGVHSFETERKPANPFDLPCDADWESSSAAQFWDMSTLQAALPNNQMPASYADASQSWFPQNSVPSYVPGVTFGPSGADTLGFQMPSTQISDGAKMKVLCVHGFRTSGSIFRKQLTTKWGDALFAHFDMDFPDGISPAEGESEVEGVFPPPYYEWFQFNEEFTEFRNLEECVKYLDEYITGKGPYDGIIGFSQGATLSALLLGFQAQGKILKDHPPMKMFICISGTMLGVPSLNGAAYKNPVGVKSLHLIGQKDPLSVHCEDLAKAFENPLVIRHRHGHTVPWLGEEDMQKLRNWVMEVV